MLSAPPASFRQQHFLIMSRHQDDASVRLIDSQCTVFTRTELTFKARSRPNGNHNKLHYEESGQNTAKWLITWM